MGLRLNLILTAWQYGEPAPPQRGNKCDNLSRKTGNNLPLLSVLCLGIYLRSNCNCLDYYKIVWL